jgi:hypothetical protein
MLRGSPSAGRLRWALWCVVAALVVGLALLTVSATARRPATPVTK